MPGAARGGGRAAWPPRPAPSAGRPRSARGSPAGRAAGGANGGRATPRRGRRRRPGREPVTDDPPGRAASVGRGDPGEVALVDRAVALVRAADAGPDRRCSGSACGSGPRAARRRASLSQTISSRTTLRPQVAQRRGELLPQPDLERDLLARGRGDGLERRVEMAHVRRPEDDLGEQPGQRASTRGSGLALPVERGAGNPAASADGGRRRRRRRLVSPRSGQPTSSGGGGGASRSKAGSENPGSLRSGRSRPAMARHPATTSRSGG